MWMQLGSLFFSLAGVFGDLLIIRMLLFLAYVCLFVNTILGAPLWPHLVQNDEPRGFAVDSFVWSVIGLCVHGASLVNLWRDELPVKIMKTAPSLTGTGSKGACDCENVNARKEDEDEITRALWRMFYRTGGLSQRLFAQIIVPHLTIVQYDQGEVIPTHNYFYILYQGQVKLEVIAANNTPIKQRMVFSGGMFDIECLGLFHEGSIFHQQAIKVTSHSDTTILLRFEQSEIVHISHHTFVKNVWQALLIYNLTYVVEAYLDPDAHSCKSLTVDPIFAPLQKWEEPEAHRPGSGRAWKRPLQHILRCMQNSFSPPFQHPTGIRHANLPAPQGYPLDDPSVSSQYDRIQKAIWKSEDQRNTGLQEIAVANEDVENQPISSARN